MSAVLSPPNVVPIDAGAKKLDELVIEWMQAKAQEEAANDRRLLAERRILALQPAAEEGSTTVKLDSGFKLTVTGKLTYKCTDPKALAEVCAGRGWEPRLIPVKTEVKLDETGAKWLRANEPQMWAQLAEFVTVAPAKTSVAVKV